MSPEAATRRPPTIGARATAWTRRASLLGWALLGLILAACGESDAPRFVHVEAGKVVDEEGHPSWLRGVTLGNWSNDPEQAPKHEDFAQLGARGIDTIRILFNPETREYDLFRDLDENLVWAKQHGMRLIFDAMMPPAPPEEESPEQVCGHAARWPDPTRFQSLWRSLAQRYRDEPAVAAYGLLHTPSPPSLRDWRILINSVVRKIREVDPRHMLLAARPVSTKCSKDERRAEEPLSLIDDLNVLYEFEHMEPWEYVAPTADPEISYPRPPTDAEAADTTGGTWLHASWDARPAGEKPLTLLPTDTEWGDERHFFYTVTNEQFEIAVPVLQSDLNPGTAYFAGIQIKEYDSTGGLRQTFEPDMTNSEDWYLWEGNAAGDAVPRTLGASFGAAEDGVRRAIFISGTTTLANLSSAKQAFRVTHGHTYEVTGWMRGSGVPETAQVMIRLDFWRSMALTPKDLDALFEDFSAWALEKNVPLGVSEFGTSHPSFDGRGGLEWVRDTVDLMVARNLHFSYYAYRDPVWGIAQHPSALDHLKD